MTPRDLKRGDDMQHKDIAPHERNPPINEKSILLWKVNTVSDTKMMHVSPHARSTAAKLVQKFKS